MRNQEHISANIHLKFKTILIVCYGRSGSTLLQGILNSIDSVFVKGENGNVFYHFYLAYRELHANVNRFVKSSESTHPWFGSCWFDEKRFLCDLRTLARNLLASDNTTQSKPFSTLGFKEIRYPGIDDPIPYIEFLVSIFDSPCIIHLTRNYLDVAKSQSAKLNSKMDIPVDDIVSELERFDNRMLKLRNMPYYFHIDYNEMINPSKEALAQMFIFIGADFRPSDIDTILGMPHSY